MFESTPLVRRKLTTETVVIWISGAMVAAALLPLFLVVGFLVNKALSVLSWEFLTAMPRERMSAGGIFPALLGTFYMVAGSLLVATPIGVLAAVYLNEYARENWFTRIVNLAVLNLAGVPSIVHALFGLMAFVPMMPKGHAGIVSASLTLAIMTLPVIIASTKQALASVPMAYREACWNMGASRWQTIRTIVLPNSVAGILTGIILQVSRAAGETAPVIFTGAVFYNNFLPASLFDGSMSLSMHLYGISTQGATVPESIQFGTAVVLLGLVLAVNSTAIGLRVYLRARKKW